MDIVRIQPAYPRAAFAAGREGTVTLVFTITERGEVEDAYVLRSEPPGVFDLAARAVLQRWKFLPLCIGGRWEPYREATYTMSFLLEEAYLEG